MLTIKTNQNFCKELYRYKKNFCFSIIGCEILNKTLSLPLITNPWLKDHLYYSISNDCLRFDACVDVSFSIGGWNYTKSFNAFIDLDFCKFVVNYGIESMKNSIILLSYGWGKFKHKLIGKGTISF